jgi:hypothetical protein
MSEALDMEPVRRKPGWYTDPSLASVVRWWDGARWTRHTAPNDARAQSRGAPVHPLAVIVVVLLCALGLGAISVMVVMMCFVGRIGSNK